MHKDIYDYIKSEIVAWKIDTIDLDDNWKWNMRNHIRRSFLYKNSKFFDYNNENYDLPFDNIIIPALNVQYRTEGFDVKNIVPYVNDIKNYHKSFFVKKYHPRWARKHNLDTFIDELVESYVDYGLALIKEINGVKPMVVDLRKIVFCDQHDATRLICLEHNYTPAELKSETKWYQDKIDDVILLNNKNPKEKQKNIIKVYELHGELPEDWLIARGDKNKYVRQMQIIAFYENDENKGGICLYKGKSKQLFKALKREDTGLKDRACGRGAVEELFDPQLWVNYDAIQIKEMLDMASLFLIQTADKQASQRQKITELEKGEVLYHDDGKPFNRVDMRPINKAEFERNTAKWEQRARLISSADEALLGLNPSSGTPLGTTQITTGQNLGIHQYRQGKIATFVAELYRDSILQYLVNDINRGQEFLEELTFEEVEEISEKISTNIANKRIKEIVLNLKQGDITPEKMEMLKNMKDIVKTEFKKGGSKRFIEIVKDEIKDIPIDVEVNIAGKQKDLAQINEKLSNIVKTFISDPRFQNDDMGKLLLGIFETAGLDTLNFSSFGKVFKKPDAIPSPIQNNATTV